MKLCMTENEYGTPVNLYLCDTCGSSYTVCPAPDSDDNWKSCLSVECASYDPSRDVDWLFVDE